MNGAQSLLRTLISGGVEICFTNPGTSEMYFVAALDQVQEMRPVLCLFEGVVSGAADGYARMADKPAVTLLHLGPGLANALANFHNAKKAHVPIVNIVGEHATYHRQCNPPLASDISAFATTVSGWIRTVESPGEVAASAQAAIAAAYRPPGQIATLIVPADCSWKDAPEPLHDPIPEPVYTGIDDNAVASVAEALLGGGQAGLLMSGKVLRQQGLALAGKIAARTGARLFCDTFNARIERGAGRTPIFTLPYFPEQSLATLAGLDHLVLVGTKPPVSFFAYPGVPNHLTPESTQTHILAGPEQDGLEALQRLVERIGVAGETPRIQEATQLLPGSGEFNPQTMAQSIGAMLPEQAIVVDEALTSGLPLPSMTVGAPPHDWLAGTGGSIGLGSPLAVGAAVASPGRRVLCLEADGSGMYTLQALWTQARESLDVTTVIYSNRAYQILQIEHHRLGIGPPGTRVQGMMSLDHPPLDWIKLAQGMGVPAHRATTIEEFNHALEGCLKEPGPNLIEALI